MIANGCVAAVHIGRAERLQNAGRGGRGLTTAYRKSPVSGPVAVGHLGLDGDVQHNRRYHGGPEKAVYAYPLAGYAGWQADFPDIADRFGAGAMGENLVVTGQDEAGICIGDFVRCGTATLQVAQIREPCSTFAAMLGTTRVVRAMVRSGRCGWYCRVIAPGLIGPGDGHDIIDRPNPTWTVARFAAFAAAKTAPPDILHELGGLPGLAPEWQQHARAMLAALPDA